MSPAAGTRYCFKGQETDRFGIPLKDKQNNNPKENKTPAVDDTVKNVLKFIAHRNHVPLRILRSTFGKPEVDEILATLQELNLIAAKRHSVYQATDLGIQHLKENAYERPQELTAAEIKVLYHVEYEERVLNRPGLDWERLFCRIGTDVFEALKHLLKICYIFEDRNITCPTYRTSIEGRTALRIARYGL
jgi:hypothetical protein